jgi:glucose/arabinose dehydrogenase
MGKVLRLAAVILAVLLAFMAGGCVPSPTGSDASGPSVRAGDGAAVPGTPLPETVQVPGSTFRDLATNLSVPWSLVELPDATLLFSERDTAAVKEVLPGGSTRTVGTVQGVVPGGEGGLLGLAVHASSCGVGTGAPSCLDLFAYFTSSTDNRIVRMPLSGSAGSYRLGPAQNILTGIAKAGNHNGGRLAFGPDGMLYATAGDAGNRQLAQDRSALNGKILRLTPDGTAPADNPIPGSLVYSLGHRNPQGLAWDSSGRLWSSEFGQNTWDELNLITPGSNYGWPEVEGLSPDRPEFTSPVLQWPTAEASPSGLAISGTTIYMAALRGQRLWVVQVGPDQGQPSAAAYLIGRFGRLRDVQVQDGALLLLTNNTDGRGSPKDGDDRLLSVPLVRGAPKD